MEKVVCEHTTSRIPVFRRSCETSVLSVWRVAERANKKKGKREGKSEENNRTTFSALQLHSSFNA